MTRLLSAIARRRSELLVGREPLDIDRLISPLRYDVLVREEYLSFLRVNRDVYDGDFGAYVELAKSEPYYAWFRAVAIHRIRPGKDNHGGELEAAFRERLRKTTLLADRFAGRGFDPQYPIVVRTAGPMAVTDTGKSVAGRLFPSEGCHRLALLRLAGHREVPPAWYRIRAEAGWQPPDNTGTLITALGLTPAEYFEFLSLGYSSGLHRDADALLGHVAAAGDADELRRIIAVDSARFDRAMDA